MQEPIVGIALLPDEESSRRLIELSRLAGEALDTRFVLSNDLPGPFPHFSLFHLRVEREQMGELVGALQRKMAGFQASGECTGLVVTNSKWLFLQTEGTFLQIAQEDVVEVAAPLRAGDITIRWPMTAAQQEAHRRYGYPNVGPAAWDKHFTLSVLRHKRRDGSLSLAGFEPGQEWQAAALAVVRIGKLGTATEILHRIEL